MVFERLEACAALASPEAKARMLVLTYVSALKMANTAYGINGAMFIQKHGCLVAKYHHGQPSKTTCEQILTEHGGRSPPIDGHQEVQCVLFRQQCMEKLCVELDFLFRSKDDQSAHCQQLESSFLPCNSSSCPLEIGKEKIRQDFQVESVFFGPPLCWPNFFFANPAIMKAVLHDPDQKSKSL